MPRSIYNNNNISSTNYLRKRNSCITCTTLSLLFTGYLEVCFLRFEPIRVMENYVGKCMKIDKNISRT
jgi:hypothetical protein